MKQYSEQFDAFYDDETNEWLESQCGDPDCEFCNARPDRPITPHNPTLVSFCSTNPTQPTPETTMQNQPTAINLNAETIKAHDAKQRETTNLTTEQLIPTLEAAYQETVTNHLVQLRRATEIIAKYKEQNQLLRSLVAQYRETQTITRNLLAEILGYIENPRPRNKPLITKAINYYLDKTNPGETK